MENTDVYAKPETEEEVTTPQTQNPPALNQKQFYLIIILLAALILSVIIFGFIFYQSQNKVATSLPDSELAATTPTNTQNIPSPATTAIDTSNWQTYNNPEVGFSFKYPASVELETTDTIPNPNKLLLSVNAEKLSDIPEELPMFMGRNDALAEKDRLAKGEGEGLIKIGSIYGQTTTTLSQFEVCSVMFYKKLTFYYGDYRIMVSLSAPKDLVIKQMPNFFKLDPNNCGENKMWDRDQNFDFNKTLQQQLGTGIAQEWYNTFEAIGKTFSLTVPSPQPTIAPSGLTYKNENYGFQLTYDHPYRLQTSKDDLYGYPHGIALFYSGGQSYDIVIEVWDTQAEYENKYQYQIANLKVIQNKGKYITFLNTNSDPEAQKIIDSVTIIK